MEFISDELTEYIELHTSEELEVLKELERETWQKVLMPRMLSSHVQGRFLSLISHLIKPQKALEIGTYTGYSAICLANGLAPNGELITLEVNEELTWIQDKYWKKAGVDEKITRIIGDAKESVQDVDGPFDLIFIDADKENLLLYYEACIPKLRSNGLLMVDNVLWTGKVVEPVKPSDRETKGIMALNKFIQDDPRVENVLLGIRDGIMMARKK
ncbi:MAG: O-methyltransferase [Bacteroidota bacterium]